MRDALPETVIPRQAAQQALVLGGVLPHEATPRLAEAYVLSAPVDVTLRFSAISEEKVLMTGHLETRVQLECQRCLENFEQLLVAEVDVEFGPEAVGPDNQEILRETLSGIDEKLVLASFIEDELLLSAPMVALHSEGACQPPGEAPTENETVVSVQRRPFGDLRSLLDGGEHD